VIAIVHLRLMDDALHSSAASAERSDLVVQIGGDGEGNILKAMARLEDLTADAMNSMREQVKALRDEEGPAAPVRPMPRGRR
jgi:hypothetical protein